MEPWETRRRREQPRRIQTERKIGMPTASLAGLYVKASADSATPTSLNPPQRDLRSVVVSRAAAAGEIGAGDLGWVYFAGTAYHSLQYLIVRGRFTLDEPQRVDACDDKCL
jgi:hypothetical protein